MRTLSLHPYFHLKTVYEHSKSCLQQCTAASCSAFVYTPSPALELKIFSAFIANFEMNIDKTCYLTCIDLLALCGGYFLRCVYSVM